MSSDDLDNKAADSEIPSSCDPKLTRKAFLKRVAKYAAAGGMIAAAPVVLDKFLVPPVYATGTRLSAPGSASDYPSGYGTDTSVMNPSA